MLRVKRGSSPALAVAGVLLLMAILLPGPATAQEEEEGPPSPFNLSIGLLNTQPLGGLRTGPGIGAALAGTYAFDAARVFRIRADFRGGLYGHETREFCAGGAIGCWIRLDVNTSYMSLYGGLGPEIVLPLGAVDLALAVTAGIGAFSVSSSLKGVDGGESFGQTDHFDDAFFALSAGGDLRVPVSRKVAVSAGTYYQHNGRASYVVEGGISQRPDGSLDVTPLTTDANMVAIVLGVSIRP